MSSETSIDDAQLAAYLAGDLDDLTARRIESRLANEPELGERLDRIHDALLRVRQPDEVEPPPELEARLRQRLAQESLGRPARETPWTRYRVVGGVAAGVLALAVVGGTLFGGLPASDDAEDMATMDTAEPPEPRADRDEVAEDAPAAEEEADAPEAEVPEGAEVPAEDTPREMAAPDSVLDEYEHPIPPEDAPEAADRQWTEMVDVDAVDCRDNVEDAAPGPAVPVAMTESERQGQRVFVFELATAVDDDAPLGDFARITVDAGTCEVVASEVTR